MCNDVFPRMGFAVVLLALVGGAGMTSSATGASPDEKAAADFYRGKTVRIVVGFAPGGG